MSNDSRRHLMEALRKTADSLNAVAWKVSKLMVQGAFPVVGLIDLEPPRDRRLSRLDDARTALEDGLAALDELKREAEAKQQQHDRTLLQLHRTLASHETAQQKLEAVEEAMQANVEAFRILHGVTDPRKERVIGFWTGFAASAAVTVAWAVGSWAWGKWGFLLINMLQG